MDGVTWLIVIAIAIWFLSNAGSSSDYKSSGTSRSSMSDDGLKARTQNSARTVSEHSGTSNVIKEGFQPEDRCSCGGNWIKRENRNTGGRFFSCSRYPSCKNSREQVLKARLGSEYDEIYCSRGHHKPTSGIVYDYKRGIAVCKKCVSKGYLALPSRGTSTRESSESRVRSSEISKNKKTGGQMRGRSERCRNGHPRTYENTYIRPDGSRECRVCKRNAR